MADRSEVVGARFTPLEARRIDRLARKLATDRSGIVRLAVGELVGRMGFAAADPGDVQRVNGGIPYTEAELMEWVLRGVPDT